MKRILTLYFIIFSTFAPLQSWALPPCPSSQNAYYHNCYGTYEWTSGEFKGDQYIGEWKDNKLHGKGTYYFLANNEFKGDIYVGAYKDGEKHGQGTYTWADGAKEVGEFRNDYLNGFAIRYDKNGNILKEGIWKDDEFQYAQKKSSSSSNSSSKLNKYKEFCGEIGFTPGTEKFGECVLKAMEVE